VRPGYGETVSRLKRGVRYEKAERGREVVTSHSKGVANVGIGKVEVKGKGRETGDRSG
jgi:hypothetical protein